MLWDIQKSMYEEGNMKSYSIGISNRLWDADKNRHRWILQIHWGLAFWMFWPREKRGKNRGHDSAT